MNILVPGQQNILMLNHVYPVLTGKLSTLTHFSPEPQCKGYSFFDQAVADFECGLDFIFTNCIKTQNWMHPLIGLIQ